MTYYRTVSPLADEKQRNWKETPIWLKALFLLYIFLSYFETYFIPFIGNNTKYLMLCIICLFVIIHFGKIRIDRYGLWFVCWFAFLCLSILWSSGANDSVHMHFLSLIGNVLFLFVVGGERHDDAFIRLNLQGHYWVSFAFGALSILFHRSYISEIFVQRQVLTLFGQQNDPNNCAAFLVVGISLALYSIIYEKKSIWLNLIVITINGFAILLTASRSGLVSMALIAVLFILLPNQTRKTQIKKTINKSLVTITGIVLIVYLGLKLLPEASLTRLQTLEQYSEGSGRVELWNYALDLISQKPLFGWGWGGYSYGYSVGIHNTYLTIWCDAGIIGLLLFLTPIISMSLQALKTRNVLVIILLICGLFPSFFLDAINKRFFWNAVVLSLVLINYQKSRGRNIVMWGKDT